MIDDYIKASDEMDSLKENYMADKTLVTLEDIPSLLNVARKLRNRDQTLNVYLLYKFPEARAKLFSQITEACNILAGELTEQKDREVFIDYLEKCYMSILNENLKHTDKQALCSLLDTLNLPKDIEEQFIKGVGVSGLIT